MVQSHPGSPKSHKNQVLTTCVLAAWSGEEAVQQPCNNSARLTSNPCIRGKLSPLISRSYREGRHSARVCRPELRGTLDACAFHRRLRADDRWMPSGTEPYP